MYVAKAVIVDVNALKSAIVGQFEMIDVLSLVLYYKGKQN